MTAPQCTEVYDGFEGTTLHRPDCPHRIDETSRAGFIAWTDNSDPIPVHFARDGAVTVDDAGLVAMIRGTLGPDGLGQYLDAPDVLATVLGLVELPTRPDGRRDILPMAGTVSECDATGAELDAIGTGPDGLPDITPDNPYGLPEA